MEVKAKLRYLRMSPRKVRLVIDSVRGLDVGAAESQLRFIPKAAAKPVLKLLASAIANAEHNFNLNKSNLYIKEIRVDDGPTLKRWMPKAMGRADTIRKRSSHINLVLDEREKTQSPEKSKGSAVKEGAEVKRPKKAADKAGADNLKKINKTNKKARTKK